MTWLSRNLECPDCGSSDARQESDHHWICFSCSKVTLKRNKEGINVTNNDEYTAKKERKPMKKEDLIDIGEYYELKKRGISKETARKCGISARKYTGTLQDGKDSIYLNNEWVYVFNKYHDGKVISQKLRHFEQKIWKQLGDTSNKEFYGQHLWQPSADRFCVIVGGEFDFATVVQEVGVACISVSNGESSLTSQVKTNLEWLNKWKYVAIGMDNDKAGQEALDKLLESGLLEPGKIRIITWSMKDANDMLQNNMQVEIKKNVWNASEHRPNDLIKPSERRDLVLKKPEPGPNTPWPTMTKALMGWMDNRITVIGAADGIGKSKLIDEIITDLVYNQKVKVWCYSSEQDVDEQLVRQAANRENLPLFIPGSPWKDEIIYKAIDDMEDRLTIWEPEGPVSIDSIFSKMKYAAIADDCKVFIVDHLKGVDSQLKDTHNEIGKFICDVKQFAKNYKVHILLVSHVSKNKKVSKAGQEDESWNKGRIPTKEDLYGSSAITAWADNIITLSRNVESDDDYEASITHMHFLKTRLMGIRAPKRAYLKYDVDTNRLKELSAPDYLGEDR
jgi:twinkle protein